MKRFVVIAICILCISAVAQAVEWQRYVAKDKSYSFHYPKGWKLNETDSIIEITNPANKGEQMLVVALNGDKNKSARQIADEALTMFKQGMPDIEGSNWTDHDKEGMCTFQIDFTDSGTPNAGHVLVMNTEGQAMWFSISGPKTRYDTQKAVYLLQGLVGSLAGGDSSQPPKPPAGTPIKRTPAEQAKLVKNAKAFVFVVSFALGTPFTAGQEKVLVNELMDGWSDMTMAELDKYAGYGNLVSAIMKADQNTSDKLRRELEQTIREWLGEVDQSDPGVKVIKNQLNASSKILVDGDPPLSEMAATAYAEMMAYSGLLRKNSNAAPDQIPAATVAQYKAKITKAWTALDDQSRSDACAMPGIWMTVRQVLRAGTPAEKKTIRASLAKIGGSSQTASSGSSPKSSGSKGKGSTSSQLTKNYIQHQTLMMMKQQTFNTYMWSRGYAGWTPMGKF